MNSGLGQDFPKYISSITTSTDDRQQREYSELSSVALATHGMTPADKLSSNSSFISECWLSFPKLMVCFFPFSALHLEISMFYLHGFVACDERNKTGTPSSSFTSLSITTAVHHNELGLTVSFLTFAILDPILKSNFFKVLKWLNFILFHHSQILRWVSKRLFLFFCCFN